MELGLAGKTAIVTGGSAGIGLACSKALYQEGVNVLIAARDLPRLEAAVTTIQSEHSENRTNQILTIQSDLSQPESAEKIVKTAVEHFGKIDILINNAGSAGRGSFLDLPNETFIDAWNLKLLGYIRMVQAVMPDMIKQRDGRIVNIVGAAGRTPSPSFLPGGTANAALLNFTRGISKELAQHHIRINAISPGSTSTERMEKLAEQNAFEKGISVDTIKTKMMNSIPLGKMVDPDEIASMALLLVSDRVGSITGSEIIIDGGQQPGV